MSGKHAVAVIVNESTEASELEAFTAACPHACVVFPVKDAGGLRNAAQAIHAGSSASYEAVVNLCVEEPGSGSALTAALAAVFLEQCSLPYTGCRAATLSYSFDIVFMMLHYAEVPLPPFAVVDSEAAAVRAAQGLRAPLRVRSACALLGHADATCATQAEAEATLLQAYRQHGKVVAWQVGASAARALDVVVAGGAFRGAAAAAPVKPAAQPPAWWPHGAAAARQSAAAVSRFVLYDCGLACLTLNTLTDDAEQWCFEDLVLNPPLSRLLACCGDANLLDGAASLAEVAGGLVAEARQRHPEPTFAIRLHSDSRKGYHLCAAKALRQGDVVFEDECRAFAVVTRPHVEQQWDARLKKMFTEYAWPLDSDGHLYAIWEEDPRRWRPINHSCDPNCIFAAPHSLNVVAARDIAAGEDLSMDYATFCDTTMKPFHCLCGAACCRDLISPDAASLAKYGANSWLRRVPPAVKPLQ